MRDIKFRAWNGSEMLRMPLDGVYGLERFFGFIGSDNPLMQYTGLKDASGREIYEGDIVKETYPAGYSLHEVCIGEYDNGEEYDDYIRGYGVYTKEHRYIRDYEMIIGDYSSITGEVIGNIYENPELVSQ
jgi:uncharacterized phage protein (TIGR01671 family)